jgi:hypothetical protein
LCTRRELKCPGSSLDVGLAHVVSHLAWSSAAWPVNSRSQRPSRSRPLPRQ